LEDKMRDVPADWLTLMHPIQDAMRRTADVLANDKKASTPALGDSAAIPGGADYRGLLLSALVMNGIRLTEENDPLKRADVCSDVADNLLQAIVTASAKGDRQHVSSLGKHLGAFVDRGVSGNLARVRADDKRVAELKAIMKRTDQIMQSLDKTLE